MHESAECVCVCYVVCDVHNSMTDAGMRARVCIAVRKFEVVCVCVRALKSVWGINRHFDRAVSFLNLNLSRESFC